MDGENYLKKAFRFHSKIWTYSVILLFVTAVAFPYAINMGGIIKSLFPVLYNHWWYVTSYIGFLLVAPAIKRLILTLNENEYLILIIILTIMFSVIPSITLWLPFIEPMNFVWFIYLALVLNFIKLYGRKYKMFEKLSKPWGWIVSYMLMFIVNVLLSFIGDNISFFSEYSNFYAQNFSVLQLVGSSSLFLWFVNLKMPRIKIINIVGAHILPVYLVQSNTFFSKLIWGMNIFQSIQTSMFFPAMVVIIAFLLLIGMVVFSICIEFVFGYFSKTPHWIEVKLDKIKW